MNIIERDIELAIIGGGPAGLAAAIAAKQAGIKEPLIIERNEYIGGILGQCIHDGFGLEIFKKSLTGPEYLDIYDREAKKLGISGSGDIGLIMARRLTLEGAKVLAVVEKLPYPSGLPRNVSQCLDDYEIPLLLSHTIIEIKGKKRVTGVTVARVDHDFSLIPRTEIDISCDCLILSVGLIPENELSQKAGVLLDPITGGPVIDNKLQTTVEGIFAAGNVLHVHDIVDWVSIEASQAGKNAAEYIKTSKKKRAKKSAPIKIKTGKGIKYVLPQLIHTDQDTDMYLRVKEPTKDIYIEIVANGKCIKKVKQRIVHPSVMVRLFLASEQLPRQGELIFQLQEK